MKTLTHTSQSDCSAALPLSNTHYILYFRECQYKESEQLSHDGPEGSCSCILHGKNHMLATTAAQNASVTAKTPHRGVSLRCVQLPSLADRQNMEKPPLGWLFHVLVDPRGVEPLSENPLGRLSSWTVCYEVLPGGAQTDTRHRTGSPFLDDRFKDETPMHLPC